MRRIIYIFDDINYRSGAQKASLYQMECLAKWYDIYVLSLTKPNAGLYMGAKIFEIEEVWEKSELFTKSFGEIIKGQYSLIKKVSRFLYTVSARLGLGEHYLERFLYGELERKLENFDTVVVVSEASKLRSLVSKLKKPKKIQWIHTDYALWSRYSEWTRAVTRHDTILYKKYDYIVVLSEKSREGIIGSMPCLNSKLKVIPNLVNIEEIKKRAAEFCAIPVSMKKYKFITVGRLDKEKNFDRILGICKLLDDEYIDFIWYIVGDGPLKEYIKNQIKHMKLDHRIIMTGSLENPYPLMKQSDIFVLLSDYEGTPVTIDEAAVLGLNVIATPVGGIPEQLGRYCRGTVLYDMNNLYKEFRLAMNTEADENTFIIEHFNKKIVLEIVELVK